MPKIYAAIDKLLSEPDAGVMLFVGPEPIRTENADGIEFLPQPCTRTAMAMLIGVDIPGLEPGECREVEVRLKENG